MPVDILVWMYRHVCLTAALIYQRLVKYEHSHLGLQMSACSKEAYEHLTGIIRRGVPYHGVESSIEVV